MGQLTDAAVLTWAVGQPADDAVLTWAVGQLTHARRLDVSHHRWLPGIECRAVRKISLITTGGTIEKTYDELSGELANRRSLVRRMLSELRLEETEVSVVELVVI